MNKLKQFTRRFSFESSLTAWALPLGIGWNSEGIAIIFLCFCITVELRP